MAIDADLVVTFDSGKVLFEAPGLNDWAMILKMDDKPVDEQADILTSKVVAVENIFRKNGDAVTVESLKAKDFPVPFFFTLKKKWIEAVIESSKGEAASGNVPTPA